MNRNLGNVPEQDYVRNQGVKDLLREDTRPSPASLEILMYVSMCIHFIYMFILRFQVCEIFS